MHRAFAFVLVYISGDVCVFLACPTSVLVHHQRPNGESWRPEDKLKLCFSSVNIFTLTKISTLP